MGLGAIVAGAIGTQYIKTFESNVIHLAQQKYSKLRGLLTTKATGTMQHSFRVTSARGAMQVKANQGINGGKYIDTTMESQVYNDRLAIPGAYYTADTYEWDDLTKMLADPQSILTTSMAAQVGREMDDRIVTAYHASALDTVGNSTVFAAANTVAAAAGGANIFGFSDLTNLNELMLLGEIDPDEEKFIVVPPRAVTKLLNDNKATSVDYVSLRTLEGNGTIKNYLGFTWIVSNRLNVPAANQRYIMAFTRDAAGIVVTKEPFTEIGKHPGKQFATVVQVALEFGAVRIQEAKAFRMAMLENA